MLKHTPLNQDVKIAIYGGVSIILATVVFFVMSAFPVLKYHTIDAVNKILFIPEYPFSATRDLIKYGSNWMLERETLRQQLSRVEAQNRAQAEALQKCGIAIPETDSSYIQARVILRYPEEWWREAKIDKGSADKVYPGAAVMSDGYLVGRITRTDKHSSWFELITSSSFLIAAVVDETRDLGVITGDDKGNLNLLYVTNDRSVNKNMHISTSLIGDQIPPGLIIGTIVGKGKAKEGYVPFKVVAGAHLTQLYNVEVYREGASK